MIVKWSYGNMVKVRKQRMKDGTIATTYIKEADDQYKTFTQEIKRVFANEVTVMSNRGKLYNVRLSDRVRMTMEFEVGDLAVVMPLENGWLVTDIVNVDKMPTDESAVTTLLEKLQRRKNRFIKEGRSDAEMRELDKMIEVEEKKETERQLKEMETLLGGY